MDSRPLRRKLLLLGLTCGLALALAPAAFADSVNLTRFNKTVSGVAPAAVTSVTVDLLRNTFAASGTVRQQVDTFTATPDATTHAWTGAFATHAFSTGSDQVEINYTGSTTPAQITIGGGNFLTTASSATAERIDDSATSIDGSYGLASDGSSLSCLSGACFRPFTATINGNLAPAPAGNTITFVNPVSNTDTVLITETDTSGGLGTTVTFTDSAPLLTPLPIGVTGPYNPSGRSQSSCSAFLVTNEVVCNSLTPGSYTLSQVRGGSAISTQGVTVPAQAAANTGIPSLGSASFAGLQGGDQLQLKSGPHVLTTLTVRPFTIASATPFGDLLNGTPGATVAGTCSPGEFFNDDSTELCSSTGAVPSPNDLGGNNISLFTSTGASPVDRTLAQLDDTSSGETQIDLPVIGFRTPGDGEAIHTPFAVIALGRYNDPAAMAAAVNAPGTFVGPTPVVTSSVSTAPVLFQYAPQGSTSYTTLGNINVAGGLPLPTIAPGVYVDRFTTVDARGDARYFESNFVYQGNATGPPGVSPTGPPAPSCKASATRGLKATVHSVRATTAAKKKGKKKKPAQLTVNCTSKVAGARVAVWLQRGSTVVADGSGVVKRGKVKIVLTGTVKKGTYKLIETIDSGGLATEATHTVTLK